MWSAAAEASVDNGSWWKSVSLRHKAGSVYCLPMCLVKILWVERTPQCGYYSFTLYWVGLMQPKSGVLMHTWIGGNTIHEVCPWCLGQNNLLNCRWSSLVTWRHCNKFGTTSFEVRLAAFAGAGWLGEDESSKHHDLWLARTSLNMVFCGLVCVVVSCKLCWSVCCQWLATHFYCRL
jgi:hypothetical protein